MKSPSALNEMTITLKTVNLKGKKKAKLYCLELETCLKS